jgi:TetR/AcrR family transcriptional regulator
MSKRESSNNPTRSRREREKQQRKGSIVDAAQRRFFEAGFDDVSMDEIAGDLELSKPALYRYFKNKESLYMAVVLRGMTLLRDKLSDAVNKEKTGLDKVSGYLNALCFDYVPKHADYYRVITVAREQRFMDLFKRGQVEGAREFGNMAFELLTVLINALNMGIKDKTIRPDIEPLQTAVYLVVASEAAVNLSHEYQQNLLANRGISKADFLRHSIALILQGVAAENQS